MKICLFSLGCKVSSYETDCIQEELIKMGYETTRNIEKADAYILNTCAVTNEGERKSRAVISKLIAQNKNAPIFVMGCASEKNSEQFLRKNNVVTSIGNFGKQNMAQIVHTYLNNKHLEGLNNYLGDFDEKLFCQNENFEEFREFSTFKERAYIKIQDGCNNFCSYCLIPFVRGRSRSRNIESIVKEAHLASQKAKEIVLVGINMSDFKSDNKPALIPLLERLKDIPSRIRFGSLEVNVITHEFLNVLKNMSNFCPQFHLSMQSGSNRILKLMNRHYTKEEYLSKVDLIREYFPKAIITTDVIVGFPTETHEDFLECKETILKAKFYNMHIFPYSKRDGTRASLLPLCNKDEVLKRIQELKLVNEQLKQNILKEFEGDAQNLILEEIEGDYFVGHTEHFIKCYILKDETLKAGDLVKVKILTQFQDGAKAQRI